MNRLVPPNQAKAQDEAQRLPFGTTVEKFFSRMVSPIWIPATRLPPSLSKATTALESERILRRKRSSSLDSNGPVTLTNEGSFGPRETTSIAAPRAAVVAMSKTAIARHIDPNLIQQRILDRLPLSIFLEQIIECLDCQGV